MIYIYLHCDCLLIALLAAATAVRAQTYQMFGPHVAAAVVVDAAALRSLAMAAELRAVEQRQHQITRDSSETQTPKSFMLLADTYCELAVNC